MKIKRFVAKNMRQALRRVREEQGPDAVILSNERVAGGVEIIAAVDYDESLIHQALTQVGPAPAATAEASTSGAEAGGTETAAAPTAAAEPDTEQQEASAATIEDSGNAPGSPPAVAAEAPAEAPPRVDLPRVVWAQEPAIVGMQREVAQLRSMLQDQLSSLAWRDRIRRDPAGAQIMRVLCGMGLRHDIARTIAGDIGHPQPARAVGAALANLASRLPIVTHDVLAEGGVIALIGPTGVGKTTTVAKLAARYALSHGRDELALVSTDTFRIGAREQLLTFGRILGVPVHTVGDESELPGVLDALADKRLVLIDTAGLSQRDQRLSDQLAMFEDRPIRLFLTLAANGQRDALDEAIRRFGAAPLAGCVLTKVDEAGSLGGAMTALIRHELPLAFIANGQRVPEDLKEAAGRQRWLVDRATALFREFGDAIDDDEMALGYGEVAAHA